jgi:hypothetical protein
MSTRSWFVVVLALSLSSLSACATSGRMARDTGGGGGTDGGHDAAMPVDAAMPHDGGMMVDAFVPMVDMGMGPMDMGVDAFVAPVDAGHDAFVPPVDAGRDMGVDAGRDAGVDAFVPPVDSGTGVLACSTAAACIGHIVISEVASRGPSTTAAATDEFVEIQNVGTVPVDLSGVVLAYYSASGTTATTRSTVQAGLVVQPGHFVLFGSVNFSGPTPDVTDRWTASQGIADNGCVELRVGTSAIDRFGYGTSVTFEGAAYTPSITSGGGSYERKANASSTATSMSAGGADALAGNRYDTDHNDADFITRTARDPQTMASPAE